MLLDLTSTAAQLGVSARTVERLVAAGVLPSVLVGCRRRVRPEDLQAYIVVQRGARPVQTEDATTPAVGVPA